MIIDYEYENELKLVFFFFFPIINNCNNSGGKKIKIFESIH